MLLFSLLQSCERLVCTNCPKEKKDVSVVVAIFIFILSLGIENLKVTVWNTFRFDMQVMAGSTFNIYLCFFPGKNPWKMNVPQMAKGEI